MFPSLSALGNGGGVALQDERYRTHRAVRDLLETLAAGKPLVLILDDLHWADSGTIELLGALLRRLPHGPCPDRDGDAAPPDARPTCGRVRAGAPGRKAHASRARGPDAVRDPAASRTWLRRAAATALHEDSGGNPFYLEQLARSLERAPAPAAAVARGLARSGQGATRRRRRADRGARRCSRTARASYWRVRPSRAIRSSPSWWPQRRQSRRPLAFAALDELLRCDLVRPTDVPRRFRFRHPLVRRAVYDASPGGWRLGAHERCAQALAARGASVTARVHHVERSARHGDESAVAVLREAGTAAAQRTPATAARWFAAALRVLGEGEPAGRASGAPDRAGRCTRGDRPVCGCPRRPARSAPAASGRRDGDAPAADCGMRGDGAVARPPRAKRTPASSARSKGLTTRPLHKRWR